MDDIAAEAGVAKPVLYRMFRDKAELYRAVGSSVAGEQLIPALVAELSQRRDPRSYVEAMIDTYLRLIESEPELYRFVVHPVLDERDVQPDLVRTYKEVIADHVARVIDSVLPADRDRSLTHSWSRALVGRVHEAGDWWIEQRTMSRDVLATQLTDLAWGGISALFRGSDAPASR
jgi:AcrR family transcriptional regulator